MVNGRTWLYEFFKAANVIEMLTINPWVAGQRKEREQTRRTPRFLFWVNDTGI